MRKLLFPCLSTTLLMLSATAQDTCRKITFQRAFQISQSSAPYEVMQTKDGGYLFTGAQSDELVGNGDGLLLKTNKYGEAQWINAYNRTNLDYAFFSSTQLQDSSYVSIAYMSESRAALQKTDKNGNIIWQKALGIEGRNANFSKVQTNPDGSFTVIGYMLDAFAPALGGTIIIKFNEDGNIVWQKMISNSNHLNYPTDLFFKSDTLLINGILPSADGSAPDTVYITKIDPSNGSVYTAKKIWIANTPIGNNSFFTRTDNHYISVLTLSDRVTGEGFTIVAKFNESLELEQTVKLTGIPSGTHNNARPSHDNGVVITY